MTDRYRIGGMTCQGCARSVKAAIERAVPNAEVSVDAATGLATIAGVPAETIKTAVESAGFDFLGAV